ncbi:MAG: hypothetical protein KBG28_13285 [Kofleriaceae bacterium]|nr:hypothetical protein [Kofleriaceae bacterium]
MSSLRSYLLLVGLALSAVTLTACGGDDTGGGGGVDDCTDGRDNDNDTLVDDADPGCRNGNAEADDGPSDVCRNGLDDDGDRLADFPADPGCASADDADESNDEIAQCQDGRDNDGDGKADYPEEPGCALPQDTDEADDCPSGPGCPSCSNGMDDDADGLTDFPADSGCASAAEGSEFMTNPNACGAGVMVNPLVGTQVTGMLTMGGMSDLASATCGGVGDEVAYEFALAAPKFLRATTTGGGSAIDTVLYLRSDCMMSATELACNDDDGTSMGSTIERLLEPGVYYIIVDAKNGMVGGQFQLNVELLGGDGSACMDSTECGPGLACRPPVGGGAMICRDPVCGDGADDDADGKIDYPNDPGCGSPTDDDEMDNCPAGADCPACGDGRDNDMDGMIDYPADPDCSSASQPVEACGIEDDAIGVIVGSVTAGTLVGATDDFDLSCDGSDALDKVHFLTVPTMASLVLASDAMGVDTALALLPSSCTGTALACEDDGFSAGTINLTNVTAGTYAVVFTDYGAPPGATTYTITTSGVIAAGGRCDGALAASGAIDCAAGYACVTGVCTGTAQCNNGVDDDGDGDVGYPTDPGCDSPEDMTEADTCPGVGCPVCSDGMDNDMDGQTDYPADVSCGAASGQTESCSATEGVTAITGPATTGTLVGATDDVDPTCASSSGSGPDRMYQLDVPALKELRVEVDFPSGSFDTVHAIYGASCGGAPVACSDAPLLTQTNVAAGRYYIDVDTWSASTTPGAFSLDVTGKIAAGGLCEHPLVTAGVLACEDNYACKGTAGARTCQLAACADNLDQDGDGEVGYPEDPGCDNRSDDTEVDTCPSGAGCPVCSNNLDDDGDGRIDWPSDLQCVAASQNSESCVSSEPIVPIVAAATAGTTVGQVDDVHPSCAFSGNTAPDRTYQLDLPAMATLRIELDKPSGSWDSVHALFNSTCGVPAVACNDSDIMTISTPLAAGRYYLTVDGWSTATGAYSVDLTGTIASGGRCDGPLATAGALTCVAGTTCTAGTCQ